MSSAPAVRKSGSPKVRRSKASAKTQAKTSRAIPNQSTSGLPDSRISGLSWRKGLDAKQAVSGNGRYRDFAGDDVVAMRTCVWRGHELTSLSATPTAICVPELPDAYRVTVKSRDWTGRSVDYRWSGGGFRMELRTTLPGPYFKSHSRSLHLRWPSGVEPSATKELTTGEAITFRGASKLTGGRLWCLETAQGPILLVASQPIRAIVITSHMHWRIDFARVGGACFIVPLLDAADIPRDGERQKLWLELASQPPLSAVERFREHGDTLTIAARFPGARVAPLPEWMALLGNTGHFLTLPTATTVLHGADGPYAVVSAATWEVAIAMSWSRAAIAPTRAARGKLAAIPEELAYAGDATWVPGSAMDQLIALRTWAPLLAAAPNGLREKLSLVLQPPSAAALRKGVETISEPSTKLPWGRLRQMWDHNGDACYDIDWYNGFALSGLERTVRCAVPKLANAARVTAKSCRHERDALAAYFTVFHDWSICSAWSDPRGWMWNADCCHNGLEGLLAEARLRDDEQRLADAAHLRYLAARTAVSLLASCELPAWHERLAAVVNPGRYGLTSRRMRTWGTTDIDTTSTPIATQCLVSWRDRVWCTSRTRNPYLAAGNFPEWNVLVRDHARPEHLARIAKDWDGEAERQADWLRFYLGDDWRERRKRGDQEARVQAAVFYHLAPNVWFRRFALGQTPDAIEQRFATPLNLAEQLLLRAGFALVGEAIPQLAAGAAAR